jgi:hypothetical protein
MPPLPTVHSSSLLSLYSGPKGTRWDEKKPWPTLTATKYDNQDPEPGQRSQPFIVTRTLLTHSLVPSMSSSAWSPHLERPQTSTQDRGCRPLEPGGGSRLFLPTRPLQECSVCGLPGENPIHPDTQHQGPGRQALGDKGPLLSSAEPGTRTSPAQQIWTAVHQGQGQ